MMQHLQFMNIPLNVEADSKIVINGEEYKVNYTEKLKFGEWTDAETVLKEKDYAGLLAILARKNGEIYDDDLQLMNQIREQNCLIVYLLQKHQCCLIF